MSTHIEAITATVATNEPVAGRYLLFPGYLTPNGELHLGHLSGPYLRADAVARVLRTFGAEVSTVTASDAYESGVTFAAAAVGQAPEGIAERFTNASQAALSGMGCEYDIFANPGQDQWRERISVHVADAVEGLAAAGRVEYRTEDLLACGEPGPGAAVGAFVTGRCSYCDLPQSGNVCEPCGRWLDPASGVQAWGPAGSTSDRIAVRSAFVRTGERFVELAKAVVEPAFANLAPDYVRDHGRTLRASYPSTWGMGWPTADLDGHVCSSYVLGKYGATRALGLHAAASLGHDPFSPESDVVTVAFGGIDSAFGWLSLHGLVGEGLPFSPFDYVVVNRFLLLEGSKFSTSRRHAVRVRDALEASVDPDALRLALARIAPGAVETDLVAADVALQSERDSSLLSAALRAAPHDRDNAATVVPVELETRAREALADLRATVRLPAVDLPRMAAILVAWAEGMVHGLGHDHPGFARTVLATLAEPVMPTWAEAVRDGDQPPLRPLSAHTLDALREVAR